MTTETHDRRQLDDPPPPAEPFWERLLRGLAPGFAALSIISGAPAHRGLFILLNRPDPGGPDGTRP